MNPILNYAKAEGVQKMWDLMEMLGEVTLLHEWVAYATADEVRDFVEHVERHYGVVAGSQTEGSPNHNEHMDEIA